MFKRPIVSVTVHPSPETHQDKWGESEGLWVFKVFEVSCLQSHR
jgi:hypothetical protein